MKDLYPNPRWEGGIGELDCGQLVCRQRLEERIKAIERQDRMNPHTSEYERFHLAARLEVSRFEAAVASLPRRPSTEKTNGVHIHTARRQHAP